MTNWFREEIATWPSERVDAALADWEKFEEKGVIGEGELRSDARKMATIAGGSSITTWMRDVAFECYRKKAAFVDAAVAAEREACAKIADDTIYGSYGPYTCEHIAAAIRARGET